MPVVTTEMAKARMSETMRMIVVMAEAVAMVITKPTESITASKVAVSAIVKVTAWMAVVVIMAAMAEASETAKTVAMSLAESVTVSSVKLNKYSQD